MLKIFNHNKPHLFLPDMFHGVWVDKCNRTLEISHCADGSFLISVYDQDGDAYDIDLLGGSIIKTIHLLGVLKENSTGHSFLQVEIGVKDIGPTYNLCFLVAGIDGEFRMATESDSVEDVILRPNVGLGLYDDFEDDLGAPWAFPLEDYIKCNQ